MRGSDLCSPNILLWSVCYKCSVYKAVGNLKRLLACGANTHTVFESVVCLLWEKVTANNLAIFCVTQTAIKFQHLSCAMANVNFKPKILAANTSRPYKQPYQMSNAISLEQSLQTFLLAQISLGDNLKLCIFLNCFP